MTPNIATIVCVLSSISDSGLRHKARCDRCLVGSPIIEGDLEAARRELAELGWELRHDGQTWCPECSVAARAPKHRPTARGVVRRRRR